MIKYMVLALALCGGLVAGSPQCAAQSAGSYGGWFPGKAVFGRIAARRAAIRSYHEHAGHTSNGYGSSGSHGYSSGYGSSGQTGNKATSGNTCPAGANCPNVQVDEITADDLLTFDARAVKTAQLVAATTPAKAEDFYAIEDPYEGRRREAYADWGIAPPDNVPKGTLLLAGL